MYAVVWESGAPVSVYNAKLILRRIFRRHFIPYLTLSPKDALCPPLRRCFRFDTVPAQPTMRTVLWNVRECGVVRHSLVLC